MSDSSLTVDRALRVLDIISKNGAPMGVHEISRQVGLSPSSVHRLLASLKAHRLVQQPRDARTYWLGWRLVEHANVLLRNTELRPIVAPILVKLRDLTGETAGAFVPVGRDRVCIDRVETPEQVRRTMEVGERFPLYAGASGRAILAFSSSEEIAQILGEDTLIPLTPATVIDRDQLLRLLQETRRTGIARSFGETAREVAGIATPFFRADRVVAGAIAISGPAYRWTADRMISSVDGLLAAGLEVSRRLGFDGTLRFERAGQSILNKLER
jgi:DNA-binding IclR family transcriptional regulator